MRIGVIIAAKNAEYLIGDCLESVHNELREGDQLVVISDGSSDSTANIARARGATVIELETSVGPYKARNEGCASIKVDAFVFFDTRCRAMPGWLDEHRKLLLKPGTAISYTNVRVVGGDRVAERTARAIDPFSIENYRGVAYLPYFPTCNLGVSYEAFISVSGFSDVRSGGDADLCWKVQEAGLGCVASSDAVMVNWVPRESMDQLIGQFTRYGRSSVSLLDERGQSLKLGKRAALLPARLVWQAVRLGPAVNWDPRVLLARMRVQIGYETGYIREAIKILNERRRRR